MRPSLLAVALLAVAALPLHAQRGKERIPKRPVLAAGADTNDASAYYQHGMDRLVRSPGEADDAFYWATRISPTWAEPLYARRAAQHLRDRPQLVRYLTSTSAARSKRAQAIDSLAAEAMLRSPFVRPTFDRLLLDQAIAQASEGQAWLSTQRSGDAAYDAQMAFATGRLEEATRLYGEALRRRPRDYWLRAPRARAFYLLQQLDSSAAEFGRLLDEMRRRDEKKLVFFYDSKAMLEFSLGRVHLAADRPDSARAAYGRALAEDLAFHVAHVELADLALAQGDTTTALSELALAVELRGTDAGARLLYGQTLARAKRTDEAMTQLRAAIAEEPYFALPYFHLARALEGEGRAAEAAAQYREYLARGTPRMAEAEYAEARERLQALGGAQP